MKTVLSTDYGNFEIQYDDLYIKKIGLFEGDFKENKDIPKRLKVIRDYINGKSNSLDLKFKLEGTTFQQKVWRAIADIAPEKVKSYGEIAKIIGNPKAYQAVGTACGKNPVPFIIPCHRVVGSSGLGGFSLGIELKKVLLARENF